MNQKIVDEIKNLIHGYTVDLITHQDSRSLGLINPYRDQEVNRGHLITSRLEPLNDL